MKILQIISSFPPAYSYGGPLQVAYNLSKNLVSLGHEVTVYTTDVLDKTHRNNYAENPEFLDGIEIYRFKNISNRLASIYRISCAPLLAFALDRNIAKYNIVHCHEYRSYEAIILHHYAKKYHIPYVIQAHGSVLPTFEKQWLKKIFDLIWGTRILKDASKLIAVSNIEKEQYLTMGIHENKIEIIPNGIDITEYERLPKYGEFRKKYGIATDEKIILYLGRLHKRKGIDFLINSFSCLLNLNQEVILVIAGPDDGFLDNLLKLVRKLGIKDRILFTGYLSKVEKYEVLVDADLLVYPGILEIFGLVPFEAILCGTPVIVTDDCGCGEIIKEAQCGFLVTFGDTQELCNILGNVLLNSNETKAKTQRGQLFIQTSLNWETISIKERNLYADCLCNL